MAWTRATYLSEIRHLADAEADGRWPVARVLSTLDLSYRRAWSDILNAANKYRLSKRTVTTDSSGRFTLAALSTGSGTTLETFYRILAVAVDEVFYQEIRLEDSPLARGDTLGAQNYRTWYRIGSEVQMIPATADLSVSVWVNHYPALPSALADDTVEVAFPDGYELVVAYEAAGLLLAKGGTEVEATSYLRGLAAEARNQMLGDLSRVSSAPIRMGYSDSRSDWAG